MYKCTHSEELYIQHERLDWLRIWFAYTICSNDPYFYQTCDTRLGGKITNDEVLCEYYLCNSDLGILTSLFVSLGLTCFNFCQNTNLDMVGCNEEGVAMPTGGYLCKA